MYIQNSRILFYFFFFSFFFWFESSCRNLWTRIENCRKIRAMPQIPPSLRSPSFRFESRRRGKTKEERRKRRVQYFEDGERKDGRNAGRWDYRVRLRLNGVGLEIRRLTSRFPSASLNRVINDIVDWTAEPLPQIPVDQLCVWKCIARLSMRIYFFSFFVS